MAQSQIRIPTIEELYAANAAPKSTFDPSKLTQAYATGMTLEDTIKAKTLARQQAEEELKKEIAAAKAQATQQKRVSAFTAQPDDTSLRAEAFPAEEAKFQYEKDLQRMKSASDMAKMEKSKGGPDKSLPASLLGNLLKTKGVGDFIENLQQTTDKMSQSSGLGGVAKALTLKGQEKAGGFFGGDPDVLAYEKSRPTMGRAVYKFFSGDVGNISENEGKFATDLLPSAYEDPAIRTAKIARLKDFKGKSEEALAQVLSFAKTSGLGPKETEEAIKNAAMQIMQSAVSTPLTQYQQSPANAPIPGTPSIPGGLAPEKRARLEELRRKKAEGTLGR